MRRKIMQKLGIFGCVMLFGLLFGATVNATGYEEEGRLAKVVVTNYEIEGDVEPGEDIILRANIQNMSDEEKATDVVCFLYFPVEGVYYQNGYGGTVYCGEIEPLEIKQVEYHLKVAENFNGDMSIMQLEIDYFSNSNANVTTNYITPTIRQVADLEVDLLSVAESVEYGTDLLISARYKNESMKDIKNIVMHVSGKIKGGTEEIELGDLMSEKTQTSEAYIRLTDVGMQMIRVAFSYEDENGNEYTTEEKEFEVQVTTDGVRESQSSVKELLNEWMNPFCIVLIIVAVISMGIGILILRRKK